MGNKVVQGVGLGFRREIAEEILALEGHRPAFLELAPENWIGIGGKFRQLLLQALEQYPITSHGLSLSLGSPEPLDWHFLSQLKQFFRDVPVKLYSEHLSYCKCGNAHLYDLLPLPFTEEAIAHVSSRIREVQDFLERQIAIENVSYYCPIAPQMEEAEFLSRIVEQSQCCILLDINNVYVNSFNHRYDPYEFLQKIPLDKVTYIHMAGHEKVSADLIIDTHSHGIIDPVYQLLDWTLQRIDPVPILLERDGEFNDFEGLMKELKSIETIVERSLGKVHVPG